MLCCLDGHALQLPRLKSDSNACYCRASEAGLVLVASTPFNESQEQAAATALQQLGGMFAPGKGVQAAMAQLVCDQPRLQQAYQGDGLREAAAKPFLPLPIASLQPRIKVWCFTLAW